MKLENTRNLEVQLFNVYRDIDIGISKEISFLVDKNLIESA